MDESPALWSLSEAAACLRDRRISARELVEACCARIERHGAGLNCFLSLDRAGALKRAEASDRRRAVGKSLGALDGIPVAHKDLFDRAGRVTTAGSIILADRTAPGTATVLTRLDNAGAIELGTLHTSEFAAGATGHNRHYGDCRNPWDRSRVPGGSSGGSAAAIAARLTFGSLGSDTGGSIRLPAHFCGVTGLRPSQGRVSRAGVIARSWSADAIGPLARSAEDVAHILQAIAGADADDPSAAQVAVPSYTQGLDRPLKGVRLGVPGNFFFDRLDPAIGDLLDHAIAVLGRLGADIAPVAVSDPQSLFTLAEIILKAEAASLHETWLKEQRANYDHGIAEQIEAGALIPATQYLQAKRHRAARTQDFVAEVFTKVDILFTPVYEYPTPALADCAPQSAEMAATIMATFGRCTRPFSYLGLPALAVPCGFQPDGLPAGFQLVGRPFDEALLLNAGHRYQAETDWRDRAPDLDGG